MSSQRKQIRMSNIQIRIMNKDCSSSDSSKKADLIDCGEGRDLSRFRKETYKQELDGKNQENSKHFIPGQQSANVLHDSL